MINNPIMIRKGTSASRRVIAVVQSEIRVEWCTSATRSDMLTSKEQIILVNAFVAEEASGKHRLVSAADKPDIEGLVAGRQ